MSKSYSEGTKVEWNWGNGTGTGKVETVYTKKVTHKIFWSLAAAWTTHAFKSKGK